MIRSNTVLVLGAGASCELDFPDGPTLLARIADELDIRFDHWNQISGSTILMETLKRHHQANAPDRHINDYVSAAWRLRDAAKLARSIDNAIDQNDDSQLVSAVGKLAIAHQIGIEENRSKLVRRALEPDIFELEPLARTWLPAFAQVLTTDVRASEVDTIFENLTVISFNYDRSFEAFLPTIFRTVYGFSVADAKTIANRLTIFHPYGSLGPLPWQDSEAAAVEFGGAEGRRIEQIAASLRTFTERNHDEKIVDAMRHAIAKASQLVFMGFGFHRQNMVLLDPQSDVRTTRILGTVYNEPAASVQTARDALDALCMGPGAAPPSPSVDLVNLKCGEFMSHFYSPLTA